MTGQLVAADHSEQADEHYAYDANGNRGGGGYVVGGNNQVLSDSEFDYGYDLEGNLIRKTEIAGGNVTEYAYDHRNRLVQALERAPAASSCGR